MVIRTRFQARPHCYLDECTQGPRPRSQCLNIIRHTPQYANSTDGHAARLARNHYHSPNNVYTHRCCCNTQRRFGRLAHKMEVIAGPRSQWAIGRRTQDGSHCEKKCESEKNVKKNVEVCFAGASAVLHSQNGNGHRVAPETKKIFEKKKFFFSNF